MTNDTIKDIINDIRGLAVSPNDAAARLALEDIAMRLEALNAGGERLTQRRRDAEIEKDGGTGTAADKAPAVKTDNGGKKIFRYAEMKSMPRGIEMKEFAHADGSITFIGQYVNRKSTGPNDKPKRVYKIEVAGVPIANRAIITLLECKDKKMWEAHIFEDNICVAKIDGGVKKWDAAYAALGALRCILHRRCVCTNSNRKTKRAMKAAAQNPVNPVNPV